MLPSKPRSGLSDTSNHKTVPTTLKAGKTGRAGSTKSDSGMPSPLQKSRISTKSVDTKPVVDRRVPKPNNITRDKQLCVQKGSELQSQLCEVQEDLNKAKEQLVSVEQENARILEELNDAKKSADKANEHLMEALAAQKKAEESLEIEKFRAVELEQTSIESSKRREEEWEKEIEIVKTKHSVDLEALVSTTQELEKIKNELQVTTMVKISALSQAEDAMKIAEENAVKVELFSEEISRLKSLLDSKLDSARVDTAEVNKKLESEIVSLKSELERAKQVEEKLVIMESLIERLSSEADNAKDAELHSLKLVDEWKKKVEFLEIQLVEAKQSEKSSLESLASVSKQLEECNASLQDFEFETSALKQKVELLQDRLEEASHAEKSLSESRASLAKQLEEVSASLQDAESGTAVLRGNIESLEIEMADVRKAELDKVKLAAEWKMKAETLEVQLAESNQLKELSLESLDAVTKQLEDTNSSLQVLLSEKASLRVKMETLENEIIHYKEDLMDLEQRLDVAQKEAAEMGKDVIALKSEIQILEEEKLQALNSEKIATSEAESFSEEREKLLKQLKMARVEEEKAKKAMEGLASALHEMSNDARETQDRLLAIRVEHEDAHAQIEQLRSALRNTKENYEVMLDEARYEIVCLKKALDKLETESLESQVVNKESEECISWIDEVEKMDNGGVVQEHEDENHTYESLGDTKDELQSIGPESAELLNREADSVSKVNELFALLCESPIKKSEANGDVSIGEKEYTLLPNSKKNSVLSVNGNKEAKPMSGEDQKLKEANGNGHGHLGEEVAVDVELKMWEGYKTTQKDPSSEKGNKEEDIDDDSEVGSGSFDHSNGLHSESTEDGLVSPTKKQQLQQKKKRHLFPKFGSLLKKKSPNK